MAISEAVDKLDEEDDLRTVVREIVVDETAELREENRQLRDELQQERETREAAVEELRRERSQQLARDKNKVLEEVNELHQDLINEQKTRSQSDSRIEQRLTTLADEVGVDDLETDLAGSDKLVRLTREGADSVIGGRVYPVHRRARRVLMNASDWGKRISDKNGPRVRFVAPDLKPYLDAEFNRDFETSEIERIFEKIVDLAGDSPRRVRKDKTNDGKHGNHRLTVWLVDGSLVEEDE